jgi:alpha-galactosidase
VREWEADGMGAEAQVGELRRSQEYTTGIMEAMLTNVPFRFNGNVMNTGLITNLPQGCCVEVPCMVDANGVNPCYVGALPAQLAALNASNVAVHELAVQAVLERDREAAFWACAMDPLTAAMLPLHRIREMFEEIWDAVADHLLWFDPSFDGPLPETCAP